MQSLQAEGVFSVETHIAHLVTFFEALVPDDLDRLAEFYDEHARLKDPFHEVCGLTAIRDVFLRMFEQLERPRFAVHDVVASGDQCFMTWAFLFRQPRLGPAEQCIRGCTHFQFGADGRITLHRDYWDAAEELYAKMPLLGGLIRYLQRRSRATPLH